MSQLKKIMLGAAGSLLGLAALVWLLNTRDEPDLTSPVTAAAPDSAMVERGAYLARAGNCMACHTARGGASYAGGRGIVTPFGTVYTSNLTPDDATGIGSWSPAHFWRAMHNGRSRDGRLLYPAFPYTNYTQVTREDSDALFAYLKSLTPVAQAIDEVGTAVPLCVARGIRLVGNRAEVQRTPHRQRGLRLVRKAYGGRQVGLCHGRQAFKVGQQCI